VLVGPCQLLVSHHIELVLLGANYLVRMLEGMTHGKKGSQFLSVCIRPEFTQNFTRSQNKLRRTSGHPPLQAYIRDQRPATPLVEGNKLGFWIFLNIFSCSLVQLQIQEPSQHRQRNNAEYILYRIRLSIS